MHPTSSAFLNDMIKALQPGASVNVLAHLEIDFISEVDIEAYAAPIVWESSYTTLHDYALGEFVMSRTSILGDFHEYVGRHRVGKILETLEQISGEVATNYRNNFAAMMEGLLENQEKDRNSRVRFATLIGKRLKASPWWEKNRDWIDRRLKKNRDRINKVKAVQNS